MEFLNGKQLQVNVAEIIITFFALFKIHSVLPTSITIAFFYRGQHKRLTTSKKISKNIIVQQYSM